MGDARTVLNGRLPTTNGVDTEYHAVVRVQIADAAYRAKHYRDWRDAHYARYWDYPHIQWEIDIRMAFGCDTLQDFYRLSGSQNTRFTRQWLQGQGKWRGDTLVQRADMIGVTPTFVRDVEHEAQKEWMRWRRLKKGEIPSEPSPISVLWRSYFRPVMEAGRYILDDIPPPPPYVLPTETAVKAAKAKVTPPTLEVGVPTEEEEETYDKIRENRVFPDEIGAEEEEFDGD